MADEPDRWRRSRSTATGACSRQPPASAASLQRRSACGCRGGRADCSSPRVLPPGRRWSCGCLRAPSTTRWFHRPTRMPPRCSRQARSGTCGFGLDGYGSPEGPQLKVRPASATATRCLACTGIAALMRWQDAILLASVALELLVRVRARRFSLATAVWLGCCRGRRRAVAFVPQMIVWMTFYGQPLAMPQGGGFMRWTEPALLRCSFPIGTGC